MRKLLISLLILLLALPVIAQDGTIVDIASGNEDFETLVAAVVEAELVETLSGGEFTVFAPTDGAFETLLTNLDATAEDLLMREDLAAILTYHVVPGTIFSGPLVDMINAEEDGSLEVETVNGAMLTFTFDAEESLVEINGGAASVSVVDIQASNGVIHVIDNVLLPPMGDMDMMSDDDMSEEDMTEAMTGDTIVGVAATADNFNTLVAAVGEAGLVSTLSSGEYTVFAPTDGAFETLLTNLEATAEDLLMREDLAAILTYHVVPGTIFSGELVEMIQAEEDGSLEVETVNGAMLTFTFDEEESLVLINDGAAAITAVDIEASNGVIHVIDNVLLPPMDMMDDEMMDDEDMSEDMDGDMMMMEGSIAEIVVNGEDFTVLEAALTEAGLVETFAGEGSFTVFAPTDQAFANLLASTDLTVEQLLASDLLDEILLYHVAEGELFAADVVAADETGIPTLLETTLIGVSVSDNGIVTLNGVAGLDATDIEATNGVIHVVDEVLLPGVALEVLFPAEESSTTGEG
jgi:transforming growth factor-beta-induced protein